jgi:hypothetical protein
MSFLDRFTHDHFRVLSDGRTIFLPKGPDGPSYLVPDDTTRQRLERSLKASGVLVTLLAVALGKFLFTRGTFHWLWLLAIPVMAFLKWRTAARAAEQLQEYHDSQMFEQVPEPSLAEDSRWQSWTLAGGAATAVAAGVVMFVAYPVRWVQWVGLLIAAVSAWFVQLALQDIRRSRALHRRAADWHTQRRTHTWSGRSGNRRRFS